MKKLIILSLSLFLFACGSNVQNNQTGLEHEQQVVLIADKLVGKIISVGPISNHVIAKNELTPYATGVAGVADAKDENSEILTIKLDQGSHQINVKNASGEVIYSKQIYLANGQVRTIRL